MKCGHPKQWLNMQCYNTYTCRLANCVQAYFSNDLGDLQSLRTTRTSLQKAQQLHCPPKLHRGCQEARQSVFTPFLGPIL